MLSRGMAKKSLGTTSLVSLELNQPLIVDISPYLQPFILCLSLVILLGFWSLMEECFSYLRLGRNFRAYLIQISFLPIKIVNLAPLGYCKFSVLLKATDFIFLLFIIVKAKF